MPPTEAPESHVAMPLGANTSVPPAKTPEHEEDADQQQAAGHSVRGVDKVSTTMLPRSVAEGCSVEALLR